MNKFLILLCLSVIGINSCSRDTDSPQPETYTNSINFGEDNYGIQLVYAKQGSTLNNLNLFMSSLSKQQLMSLQEGSGASIEIEDIPAEGYGFYAKLPTYHSYVAEVNNAKLLRSNGGESKRASEGYIEVLEYTEDNIKLKYSYTRKDGVVFKGEYNGPIESDL